MSLPAFTVRLPTRASWLRPVPAPLRLYAPSLRRLRVVAPRARRSFYSGASAEATNNGVPTNASSIFEPLDTFPRRHIGPTPSSTEEMLKALHPPVNSLDEFIEQVLPPGILSSQDLKIEGPRSFHGEPAGTDPSQTGFTESQLLARLTEIAKENKVLRSYIGCGYAGTRVPEVIKRNVLEGPGWYTSYTPYQAEISQGRLESLLNFQTLVSDLTALSISNASVLDEPTAAAEAMTMSMNALPASRLKRPGKTFLVSHLVHPQTIAVLSSRAEGFGLKIEVGDVLADDHAAVSRLGEDLVGVLAQYPDTEGGVEDFASLADVVHKLGSTFSVATDLLALTLLKPPGEFGADIAFGNAQRFGVPFGYGGPHAAFFACNDKQKRKIPGRLVGVSKDRLGNRALRLALQTREQHIRREKATSNICTAQALLANMSAFYAIYHGPQGLRAIARKVVAAARVLEEGIRRLGYKTGSRGKGPKGQVLFDTVVVDTDSIAAQELVEWGAAHKMINLRKITDGRVGVTLDETVENKDLADILAIFAHFASSKDHITVDQVGKDLQLTSLDALSVPTTLRRTSEFLTHPVFNTYHSETALLRYIHHLQSRDISLTHSMIPLGSCTMKLNATTEMVPVSWPEFSSLHPFAPTDQAKGYKTLIDELEKDLATITGFEAVTLQPNSGAQGEFTGLRLIRKYLETQPGEKRDICLIPVSAHGTNPASAAMAGMRVVTVKCDTDTGNLDMEDLKSKCEKYSKQLGAIMITYPSTFGVFEPDVKKACELVHEHGGQVYMDGANVNAQIGLCTPGDIGADVCHLNLHKTFCIPHGGGGPGVGPVGVKGHLAPFLPGHPLVRLGGEHAVAPISGAPWGSASILPISWAYIKMMGGRGLTHATKITLLNANYILSRLSPHYPILYTNPSSRCAHEFILDVRKFKDTCGVEAIDIAKRLQDYGFHAPTMSWPVANTLMIEPTESENKAELDRFCDSLIQIRREIQEVEDGQQPKEGNVLKMAPHTVQDLTSEDWNRSYERHRAAYPLPWLREKKFWPTVTRLDDAYGDMNLFWSKGSKLEMPKSEDVKPKSPAPSIQLHKADRAPVVTETPESAKGKTVRDAKTESALIEQYWSSDEFAHYKRLKNLRQFLKETSRAYLNIPDKTVRALTPAEYTLLDTKLNLMDRCVEKVTNGEVPTLTADERDVIEQPCGKIVGLGGDIYRRGPMEKIKRWRG
ncbi:MAG: glycine decarboxylase subunit P [Piccolia ochrophora]|nr:MAG: glycine decarboxylase subunit P [Piccolia ochrophora]